MSDTPKALAIDAADGVEVHIDDSSETETFDVKVRKAGEEVEAHTGLTIDDLAALDSEHFSVDLVEPPTAPEPGDEDTDEVDDAG